MSTLYLRKGEVMARAIFCMVVCGVYFTRSGDLNAIEPPQRSSSLSKSRSGITTPFGSGTLTRRTDGSSAHTSKFGKGSITSERDSSGKVVRGITQPFGSGTLTRWSDGTVTRTSPFGSGTLTKETGADGKPLRVARRASAKEP